MVRIMAGALLCLGAASLAACVPARKTTNLDVYLEQFQSVKSAGEDIYLRASGVAEEVSVSTSVLAARAASLEARLDALRLIDDYDRVLAGLARGEDPKTLKSGMKTVGGKLADYRPSAQNTFALVAAIPYLGTVVTGAGYVQELLAKRRFVESVHAAQKPIDAILDVLLADAAPLEEVLVEQARKAQDPYRAQLDALDARAYRRLRVLGPDDALKGLVGRHNAARRAAGLVPLPYDPKPDVAAPASEEVESLGVLLAQADLSLLGYSRLAERIAAERALFARYQGALSAAKRALAALNKDSEDERAAATGAFSAEALGMRREALRLQEAR